MADKVELNHREMGKLLRSEEVRVDLGRRALAIAAAAGPGMEASSTIGRRRALAMVRTATFEAMLAEARDRRLTSSIDAGRG